MRAGEIRTTSVGGTSYGFRTPDLYDPAKARRVLTRQGVRRPSPTEFKVAALKGIEAVAEKAGEAEEGLRQAELLEQWYALLEPVREDDIDEPDLMLRGEELLRRATERRTGQMAIYPEVSAIEATLERHWPPYAELLADRAYWDDISRIEIVRLLLIEADGSELARDEEKLLTQASYEAIPKAHRVPLATFALGLIAPNEAQRKN